MSSWIGLPENKEDYLGFIYLITNKKNGKKYIGKKQLWKRIRRKPLKGKKRVRIDKVKSDYETYYGSCKRLLADVKEQGEQDFKREVLQLCKNKFDLAYNELVYQIEKDVLFRDDYYNRIINVRLKK
jgi:hypothetical protein